MLTISIILEVEVAIIAVLAARRGNPYIYGLAFTFGAYVLYDLGVSSNVQGGLLSGLFLFATITALIAVWGLYRNRSTKKPGGSQAMSKLAWIVVFATLTAAPAAAQQGAIPDLRGTWKGESESIILGAGNPHHAAPPSSEPRLNSVAFTMTVDKQDGRRFSGTFSSARGSDKFVGVISRNNTIFLVDDDGYTVGTVLAPNRMEWCYMHLSQATRVASCTELTKQP